ncbi:trehalose synthase [Pontibacter diazotrophicus]|uniref:Trehalose synthase n=1 Tax=Pontibacter diazotrophicus TaxID=1400979 RepID=A0A3D8LHA8_9BACT|nr:alpha-amylase family protein [Pontibacter diazotrophicus]RDV16738.1 trehalose synthase [Pontibacter diazotrophicus]
MDKLWYKEAVFYAVDVESFQDGNGDGVGDFKGLTSRLDYLGELGINCLWLLPFFTTPNRDNGYDVRDYYSIDARLGNLHDFSEFVAAARERKIRVLIDLIIHHTSDEHAWFQAASTDPSSKFHQYYVWQEDKPVDETENVFPGEEDSVWTYEKRAGAYYHHQFYSFEPDLNVANPEVQKEILSIIEFWLAFGIDGFRVDAATHLLRSKGIKGTAVKKPAAFLKSLREAATKKSDATILLAEADVEPEKLDFYYGKGNRFNMLFNFLLDNYLFLALAREDAKPIADYLNRPIPPADCQWANFLRNLDELDLERLTEQERQDVFDTFAPEENMRIFFRGIRRRMAPMLNGDRKYLELAYSLLFTMPGSPLLVYGDELGMGDNLDLPGRASVRTPMQWTNENTGGFSTAPLDNLFRKPITKGPFSVKKINVESQRHDSLSLLNWMKRLIMMRKNCLEIGWGAPKVLISDQPQVLVHSYDWKGNVLVFAHNLSAKPCQLSIHSREFHLRQFVDIFSDVDYEPTKEDTTQIELGGHGYRWFRVNQLKTKQ